MCFDKLKDMVYKYRNTYRTIKMKPKDVQPTTTYIDFDVENNDKHVKYKAGFNEGTSK